MNRSRIAVLALVLASVPCAVSAADAKGAPGAAGAAGTAAPAAPAADAGQQSLAERMRAEKRAIVASNMSFTDAEAAAFWPVFEEYQQALIDLNANTAKRASVFREAQANNTMTDELGRKLLDELIATEQAEVDMRRSFVPKLLKAVPPVKAARYLEIESTLRAMLRAQAASRGAR